MNSVQISNPNLGVQTSNNTAKVQDKIAGIDTLGEGSFDEQYLNAAKESSQIFQQT